MKLETFFEKFEQFSEAPNAVAKMRELVLGLAVRGKLVEQDPSDEPASELLKQIYAAKSDRRFCAELGEDPTASSDRYPLVIPNSWQWVGATTPAKIISDVGKKIQTKDVLPVGTYPVVDQGKVFIRGYYDDPEKVIKVTEPIVLFGDHTRETKLIDFDFVVGADGVKLLQPLCIDPFYYFLALRWLPLDSRGYGRHFKLLRASVIPLPPLAEQKRIVAKVDELMALCDRLETQQQERDTRHATLARASLARFADAPTPANLNHLFHPSYAITPADLRKTILTLAVQGKLVPQDPNDEPASELIEHIRQQKQDLSKKGEIGKQDLSSKIDDNDIPYEVPEGWVWARWDAIALKIGDIDHKMPDAVDKGIPYVSPRDFFPANQIDFDGAKRISFDDFVRLSAKIKPEVGDLIYPRYGTIGECRLVTVQIDFLASYSCAVIKTMPNLIDAKYQYSFSISDLCRNQARAAENKTTQANVGIKSIKEFLFPLPPLAEQRRIVAKVDQLMALVDQLEIQLVASRTATINLMEAAVAEMTA